MRAGDQAEILVDAGAARNRTLAVRHLINKCGWPVDAMTVSDIIKKNSADDLS